MSRAGAAAGAAGPAGCSPGARLTLQRRRLCKTAAPRGGRRRGVRGAAAASVQPPHSPHAIIPASARDGGAAAALDAGRAAWTGRATRGHRHQQDAVPRGPTGRRRTLPLRPERCITCTEGVYARPPLKDCLRARPSPLHPPTVGELPTLLSPSLSLRFCSRPTGGVQPPTPGSAAAGSWRAAHHGRGGGFGCHPPPRRWPHRAGHPPRQRRAAARSSAANQRLSYQRSAPVRPPELRAPLPPCSAAAAACRQPGSGRRRQSVPTSLAQSLFPGRSVGTRPRSARAAHARM